MHSIFQPTAFIRWFTLTDSQCEKFNTCYLRGAGEKNKRVHQFPRIKEPSIDTCSCSIWTMGNNCTNENANSLSSTQNAELLLIQQKWSLVKCGSPISHDVSVNFLTPSVLFSPLLSYLFALCGKILTRVHFRKYPRGKICMASWAVFSCL